MPSDLPSLKEWGIAKLPERQAVRDLINAPAVFQIAWRGVQKWVDPITAKKIQVLGKDYEAKFKELLPGVDVPESSRWEADPHDC